MLTIEKLDKYGADTKEGLGRCMGMESLYLRLVTNVVDQAEFDKLDKLAREGDLQGAFEAAHALKGVTGNLSLTPLYDKICEITELLRAHTDTDYETLLDQISLLRSGLKDLTV